MSLMRYCESEEFHGLAYGVKFVMWMLVQGLQDLEKYTSLSVLDDALPSWDCTGVGVGRKG